MPWHRPLWYRVSGERHRATVTNVALDGVHVCRTKKKPSVRTLNLHRDDARPPGRCLLFRQDSCVSLGGQQNQESRRDISSYTKRHSATPINSTCNRGVGDETTLQLPLLLLLRRYDVLMDYSSLSGGSSAGTFLTESLKQERRTTPKPCTGFRNRSSITHASLSLNSHNPQLLSWLDCTQQRAPHTTEERRQFFVFSSALPPYGGSAGCRERWWWVARSLPAF